LTKLYSNSLLILGIIEDIDIYKIKSPEFLHRIPNTEDLYDSIKEKGLLQPIIVRPVDDYFEIVAGNRRFESCKKLGWKKIICHIVELDDKEAFELALIENIQRKNLDPIEEAQSFKTYIVNFGWGGISELASKIGKSVSYVDKRIKLLELPPNIVNSISLAKISPTAGEELLGIRDGHKQSKLAELIQEKKISSRTIRKMAKCIREDDIDDDFLQHNIRDQISMADIDRDTQRIFDKSITILKIAAQKIAQLISEVEENWILYEIMMQHKYALDEQIDILIKQKKKS
jgi:ParB family transcriptional regulator, chromosome partitioning protein